ncbi:DUF5719 family protein [Nocardioides sp.]|uniref:DUF5719 family protein n=1 Tax=Nocardioides sp. TaxID=35761 RepID=UPI003519C23D
MSIPDPAPPTRRADRASQGARTVRGTRVDLRGFAAVLVLPVLVVGAALGVRSSADPLPARAPRTTPLALGTLVCPPGDGAVRVTSTATVPGTVAVADARTGEDDATPVEVRPGVVSTTRTGSGPVVVIGRDAAAPGLVAARVERPLAAAECRPPEVDVWFTGVGAGAKHRSTLQLTNPDEGRAVVDVTVFGRTGVVEATGLRGIAVPGGASRALDLATLLPRRDDLALHVVTSRGRISASVSDSYTEIGRGAAGIDAVPVQPAPARTLTLLGLPDGTGQRSLVIGNPGDAQTTVEVRLVTASSTFVPAGIEPVDVAPGSVVRVQIAPLLQQAARDAGGRGERLLGLELRAGAPITADLLMFVAGDLAHAGVAVPLERTALTPLPPGRRTLVLAGAPREGAVVVRTWDEAGQPLEPIRVDVAPGRAERVVLPEAARLLAVAPQGSEVRAAVLAEDDGATVLRPLQPILTGVVPDVVGGLP